MNSGRITQLKMRLLLQKKKNMKAPNNKFLLKKTVQVLCMPSQDLLQSQGNHERDCGYDMKGWEGCRVPKYRSWKNPRANRPYSRGINKIPLDGDEWFPTRAG